MTKKSGGDGDKPKAKRPRAPRKAKDKTSNVINAQDKFAQNIAKWASRIPDPSSPDNQPATHVPARPVKKQGRPQHEKTADSVAKVCALAAIGTSKELIALHMGIATETLNKHYAQELNLGFELIGMQIVTKMTEAALAGDFKAQRLWLETHMGWGKRMPRGALPTQVVNAENIPMLPAGPAGPQVPGQEDAAPPLPLNEKGDYVAEMKLGLDVKDIKEEDE